MLPDAKDLIYVYADLEGADFEGVNFQYANLKCVNFKGAVLE